MQLVSTTICYVNRSLVATAVIEFLCLTHNPGLGSCRQLRRPICAAMSQQRPGCARHLVDERHRHDLEGPPRQELREPGIFPGILLGAPQDGMRADDENAPQIAVALLGDRTELLLARSNFVAAPARSRPPCNSVQARMTAPGLVSRVTSVHTAMRNCTRDEGRSFEFGNQVLISSHRKLLCSKRHGGERCGKVGRQG
jgi:hypothetical protein